MPLPATCSAGAVWRHRAPGAARGVSCWRVSPFRHARPCAVRVAGGGGGGGWTPVLGVGARRGGTPGRWPAPPSRPPSGHWAPGCHLGLRPQSPCSPRRRRLVARHWWGVRRAMRVAARVSDEWSVAHAHRSRARGFRGFRDVCPPAARTAGGAGGGALGVGAPGPVGGVPRAVGPLLPGVRGPACWASGHCRRLWPSPAPLLARGLRLRRRRVPRAVAPVGEGSAQGPG